jgi:energy-coupling factor transporter ATP-binding protein EcfA2
MSRESVLELDAVIKVYGEEPPVPALCGVSFSVRQGELVAIVGPSGSGKSTLLHVIGTLERPSTGVVRIGGVDAARLNDRELSLRTAMCSTRRPVPRIPAPRLSLRRAAYPPRTHASTLRPTRRPADNKSADTGAFAKPSDGLEPSTPVVCSQNERRSLLCCAEGRDEAGNARDFEHAEELIERPVRALTQLQRILPRE